MKFIDLRGKLALITGASSGIGAETARQLAREGVKVALVARRRDRLDCLADEIEKNGGEALVIPADLTRPDDVQGVVEVFSSRPLDIFVNNAGFGWYGYTASMPWETALEMIRVNLIAGLQLTWSFLPGMKARGSGHIVNIGSIAGGFPQQGISMYSGTKAFIDNFTTSLYRELKGSGVYASVLRLGPVKTEFFTSSNQRSDNGYRMPAEKLAVSVESAARAVLRVLQRPRRVLYLPAWLSLTPVIEYLFGGIIDRVGPLLLQRKTK